MSRSWSAMVPEFWSRPSNWTAQWTTRQASRYGHNRFRFWACRKGFGSQPFVRENTGKMVSSGGGRGERKKKNRLFPSTNLEKLAKTSIFEVLIMAWSFLQSFSSIGANLTHFVKHFTFFPPKTCQNPDIFQKNHIFAQESGPGTHRKWKITKFCIFSTYQKLRQP